MPFFSHHLLSDLALLNSNVVVDRRSLLLAGDIHHLVSSSVLLLVVALLNHDFVKCFIFNYQHLPLHHHSICSRSLLSFPHRRLLILMPKLCHVQPGPLYLKGLKGHDSIQSCLQTPLFRTFLQFSCFVSCRWVCWEVCTCFWTTWPMK